MRINEPIKYAQTITVALSGGMFTTIQAALDSITDASVSKQYTILLYPGIYELPSQLLSLDIKDYVTVVGISRTQSIIKHNPNQSIRKIVTLGEGSGLYNLTVQGPVVSSTAIDATCVTISGKNDASIISCDLLGGQWAVEISEDGGVIPARIRVEDNSFSSPNPIWVYRGDNLRILNNRARYSGACNACHAAADAGGMSNSVFSYNDFDIDIVDVQETPSVVSYGINLSLGGNRIEENSIQMRTNRKQVIPVWITRDANTENYTKNVIRRNSIAIHSTHAQPQLSRILIQRNNDNCAVDYWIEDNNIVSTSDNIPLNDYGVFVCDAASDALFGPNPTTSAELLAMPDPCVLNIDEKSISLGIGAIPVNDFRNITVNEIKKQPNPQASISRIQVMPNIPPGAVDSLVSEPIDMSSLSAGFINQVVQNRVLTVAPYGGEATGTIEIWGTDTKGFTVHSVHVLDGSDPVEGLWPMVGVMWWRVTSPGSGHVTIGTADKFGLRYPITSLNDFLGYRKCNEAADPYTPSPMKSTVIVNTDYQTIGLGFGDSLDIAGTDWLTLYYNSTE